VPVLTNRPGGYILELHLKFTTKLQIGCLGEFTFPAGAYLYFGSACGPGGLRSRLFRHLLTPESRLLHWHIDYLNAVSRLQAYCYLEYPVHSGSSLRLECLWSQAVAGISGSSIPAPGFGASDCRCGCLAHLVAIEQEDTSQASLTGDGRLRNILATTARTTLAVDDINWPQPGNDLAWVSLGR